MAHPEAAKGWFALLYPVVEKSTPVTLLLILALGSLMGWYLLSDIRRVHAVNLTLWSQLVEAQKAQVELARRCGAPEEKR